MNERHLLWRIFLEREREQFKNIPLVMLEENDLSLFFSLSLSVFRGHSRLNWNITSPVRENSLEQASRVPELQGLVF